MDEQHTEKTVTDDAHPFPQGDRGLQYMCVNRNIQKRTSLVAFYKQVEIASGWISPLVPHGVGIGCGTVGEGLTRHLKFVFTRPP